MKTILTGVILAGLFAVAGCYQAVEKPAETGRNGGDMGSGHMQGGQEHDHSH